MRRLGAALAAVVLVALPLAYGRQPPVIALSGLAAALLLAGILRSALAPAAAGAGAALASLALALSWSSAPVGIAGPILLAPALLATLGLIDAAERANGVPMPASALGLQLRHWLTVSGAALAAAALVVAALMLWAPGLPSALRPVLAGLGALITLAAVLGGKSSAEGS